VNELVNNVEGGVTENGWGGVVGAVAAGLDNQVSHFNNNKTYLSLSLCTSINK